VAEFVSQEARQYVLLRLGAEEYGLPIKRVQSIIRYEEPTPVPRAPSGVEGVVNLRGQVIPLIDLRRLLLGRSIEVTPSSRIVVVDSQTGTVGLAVDTVHEVASIDPASVRPAPVAVLAAETGEAFEGVAQYGDRLVILLDPDKALSGPALGPSQSPGQEDGVDV
jgi:purine-binding chemotaxis protein CheW